MMEKIRSFIEKSPTPFHAVSTAARRLEEAGFAFLGEEEGWKLTPGGKYYTTRSGSSLIAFVAGGEGLNLTASHSDSPTFRIKENFQSEKEGCLLLNTEPYGGMIAASWMDRPLSAAGRALVKTETGLESRLVDLREPVAILASLAIHMDREVNRKNEIDFSRHTQPIFALPGADFREVVARAAGVEPDALLGADLSLYEPIAPYEQGGLLIGPRLDDLACAATCLEAFLMRGGEGAVYALFDNEEVGSLTRQGASSTFLAGVLARLFEAQGLTAEGRGRVLAQSRLLSCDNAHAIHPNFPQFADPSHTVRLGGGVALKYNAAQKYTTDALSASLFRLCCERAGVRVQPYANRADLPGGSTLGNLSNAQVSLLAADIGIPQLSMHAAVETAAVSDVVDFERAVGAFYASRLVKSGDRYDLEWERTTR